MHALPYAAVFLVPLVSLLAMALAGPWSFLGVPVVFLLFPLVELLVPENRQDPDRPATRLSDLILYLTVPVQYAVVVVLLWNLSQRPLAAWEMVGMALSVGMSCGVLGINAAHELGHRSKGWEQGLAKALLLTSLYMHFFIEHNRGHHKNVATNDDPASARRGETVYAFILRSMLMSFWHAWILERDRLQKAGQGVWSLHNEMLQMLITQVAAVALVGALLGLPAMLGFMLAALTGAVLLENVNYIEHYGLRRKIRPDGRPEKVQPIHSWNSDHVLGRFMLFELTRHSDHHTHAAKKFSTLVSDRSGPRLPTGYPGMMVLSWVPPVFFRIMDPRVAAHAQDC